MNTGTERFLFVLVEAQVLGGAARALKGVREVYSGLACWLNCNASERMAALKSSKLFGGAFLCLQHFRGDSFSPFFVWFVKPFDNVFLFRVGPAQCGLDVYAPWNGAQVDFVKIK